MECQKGKQFVLAVLVREERGARNNEAKRRPGELKVVII